jgi:hypothetical protein
MPSCCEPSIPAQGGRALPLDLRQIFVPLDGLAVDGNRRRIPRFEN